MSKNSMGKFGGFVKLTYLWGDPTFSAMINVKLPSDEAQKQRQLPFFLAMEEWLATRPGDLFALWQVGPTVIYGRNQVVEAEVNLEFCRQNGIEFYRRKSGGGCVYADHQNIMLARVCDSRNVEETFAAHCDMVAHALQKMGIGARRSGRNDITVDGRKISGNAFVQLPDGRAIIHGTMLFGMNPDMMEGALTPSAEKLAAKGVASVRSHVTTISELRPDLSIHEFKSGLINHLTEGELTLTPNDIAEIEALAQPYYDPAWIYKGYHSARTRRRRIEGVGEFAVAVTVDETGHIARVDFTGDYMPVGDVESLLGKLQGVALTSDEISAAIDSIDVSTVIAGLKTNDFIKLIIP